MAHQRCVFSLQVWVVAQTFSNTLGSMVNHSIGKQNKSYWLFDALVATISLDILGKSFPFYSKWCANKYKVQLIEKKSKKT